MKKLKRHQLYDFLLGEIVAVQTYVLRFYSKKTIQWYLKKLKDNNFHRRYPCVDDMIEEIKYELKRHLSTGKKFIEYKAVEFSLDNFKLRDILFDPIKIDEPSFFQKILRKIKKTKSTEIETKDCDPTPIEKPIKIKSSYVQFPNLMPKMEEPNIGKALDDSDIEALLAGVDYKLNKD